MISALFMVQEYGEVFYCPRLGRLVRKVGHTDQREFLAVGTGEWRRCEYTLNSMVVRFIPAEFTKCATELPNLGNTDYYNPAAERQHSAFVEWLWNKYPSLHDDYIDAPDDDDDDDDL